MTTNRRRSTRQLQDPRARQLREALAPYIDHDRLRAALTSGHDLRTALLDSTPPEDVEAILDIVAALVRPSERLQMRGPTDIAGMLMVEMAHLDQEQLRVVCLNTKNYVQRIVTVYQGNVNASIIRVAEVFKPAIRLNSTAIALVHNHPSTDPTPSPEDVLVTKQVIEAGNLLDINVVDHLVIGAGRWVSLRERGLAFNH